MYLYKIVSFSLYTQFKFLSCLKAINSENPKGVHFVSSLFKFTFCFARSSCPFFFYPHNWLVQSKDHFNQLQAKYLSESKMKFPILSSSIVSLQRFYIYKCDEKLERHRLFETLYGVNMFWWIIRKRNRILCTVWNVLANWKVFIQKTAITPKKAKHMHPYKGSQKNVHIIITTMCFLFMFRGKSSQSLNIL